MKNIGRSLSRFKGSDVPAFGNQLTATVNGVPVAFRELTGAGTGNEPCDPTTHHTCIGNYGTIGPDGYFYPETVGPGVPTDNGDLFQRLTTNKRIGRAVAFQNSINIIGSNIRARCERQYPRYLYLYSEEFKQDCIFSQSDIAEAQKYVGPDIYSVEYTIDENNQFIGRNRVLEFRANPLDVIELHYNLFGVENTVQVTAGNPNSEKISGKFSILDASNPASAALRLAPGRHMIPRSPSQILSRDELKQSELSCHPVGGELPTSCRPWTRLAWTEVLFGAQYRTYSDAQFTGVHTANGPQYSIERRREILRLGPEIEVDADQYQLADIIADRSLIVETQPHDQYRFFDSRDPNIAKIGGDWAFFAGRMVLKGPSASSHDFILSAPGSFDELRFAQLPTDPHPIGESAKGGDPKCGSYDHPDLDQCRGELGPHLAAGLNLKQMNVVGLQHRFVRTDEGYGPGAVRRQRSRRILAFDGRSFFYRTHKHSELLAGRRRHDLSGVANFAHASARVETGHLFCFGARGFRRFLRSSNIVRNLILREAGLLKIVLLRRFVLPRQSQVCRKKMLLNFRFVRILRSQLAGPHLWARAEQHFQLHCLQCWRKRLWWFGERF